MTMRSLDDVLISLTPERRARVAAKAKRLVRAETLRQLRAVAKKTQQDVAAATGISQHNVSRLERRDDMLLSTLNAYIDGLGGRLRLVAEFAGRETVELDLSGRPARTQRRNKPRAAAATSRARPLKRGAG
jgi:transcriptional regulator with XRE-family HTH domain